MGKPFVSPCPHFWAVQYQLLPHTPKIQAQACTPALVGARVGPMATLEHQGSPTRLPNGCKRTFLQHPEILNHQAPDSLANPGGTKPLHLT